MIQYSFQQVTEAIDIALAQSSDLYTKQIARLESEVAALRAKVEGMREEINNLRMKNHED